MNILHRVFPMLCGIAAAFAAAPAGAGPDRIAFPADYASGVLYAVVSRPDIKQYRELYTSLAVIDAIRAGKPAPDGTVLTLVQYKAQLDAQGNPVKLGNGQFVKGDLAAVAVMEKRAGWGAEYPEELRNGDWEYAAFTADGKLNEKANYKACFECHKPHAKQDYVMSHTFLAGNLPSPIPVAAAAGPGSVAIAGFAFAPNPLGVAKGQAVTWTNTDDSPHQIAVPGKPGKTEVLLKGQKGTLAFDEPGTYNYSCALHPTMKGTVEVAK